MIVQLDDRETAAVYGHSPLSESLLPTNPRSRWVAVRRHSSPVFFPGRATCGFLQQQLPGKANSSWKAMPARTHSGREAHPTCASLVWSARGNVCRYQSLGTSVFFFVCGAKLGRMAEETSIHLRFIRIIYWSLGTSTRCVSMTDCQCYCGNWHVWTCKKPLSQRWEDLIYITVIIICYYDTEH